VRPAVLVFGGLFGPAPGVPGFERIANITVAEPAAPAQVQGNQLTYHDTQDLKIGTRYTYVVVALDENGRPSPPSNRVIVSLAAAPIAPPRLDAQPGDAQVRLAWGAPPTPVARAPAPPDPVYAPFRSTTPPLPPPRPLT